MELLHIRDRMDSGSAIQQNKRFGSAENKVLN